MRCAQDGDYYVIERDEQVRVRFRPLDGESNRGVLDRIKDHGLRTTPMVVDDMAELINEVQRSKIVVDPNVIAELRARPGTAPP